MAVTSMPTRAARRQARPTLYWLIVAQLVILLGCLTVDALGLVPTQLLYPFAVPIVAIGLLNLATLDRARRVLRE